MCHNHCQQQLLKALFNLVSSSTFHSVHVLNSLGVFSIYCQSYSDGSMSELLEWFRFTESNWLSALFAETASARCCLPTTVFISYLSNLTSLSTCMSVCVCMLHSSNHEG